MYVKACQRLLFAFKQFQRENFGAKSECFKDQHVSQADMFFAFPAQPILIRIYL